MKEKFSEQLATTKPLTLEQYEMLDEDNFYIDDEQTFVNPRHKYYFSGRQKRVGDIVLIAVLTRPITNQFGFKDYSLQTITLHPDEIEDYEFSAIQPTINETFYPVITYIDKKISQTADSILDKIIKSGMKSLTEDELNVLKSTNQN